MSHASIDLARAKTQASSLVNCVVSLAFFSSEGIGLQEKSFRTLFNYQSKEFSSIFTVRPERCCFIQAGEKLFTFGDHVSCSLSWCGASVAL